MKLQKVLIIGSGTMGSGIAQWFAQQNISTELCDIKREAVDQAKDKIYQSWQKLVNKNKFTDIQEQSFKDKLSFSLLDEIKDDYDLVIEAIIENLDIKKQLFSDLDEKLNEKTIIASNTSSFPMSSLSKDLSEQRKKNFIGLHFFNPAPIMKLVEIISSCWTQQSHANDLKDFFNQNGKKPVHCNDSPGFIVNRVARNFYGESLRIAKFEDTERFEQIDSILKEVAGFRMGPFELMDLIGIDINLDVTISVWKAYFNEPRFAPHLLQKKMVESGRIGRKSKSGFYKYE
jgi:3-hydroxybutyryl-CoA dehydrogenase